MRLLAMLTAVLCCQTLTAQQQAGQPPKEFVDRYNERYLTEAPLLESVVGDVTAWDSEGMPFDLASTRGKYTVIVFGCLT